MSKKILNLSDAAKMLSIDAGVVEALLRQGEIAGREIGGEWRTTARAVLNYVDGGVGTMCCPPGTCCVPADQAVAGGCCTPAQADAAKNSGGCC